MTNAPNLVQPLMQPADDEIDLRQVASTLGRQKKFIAAVAGTTVLLSGLYALTRKPVWEGQFQIVLEDQDSGSAGRLAQLAASNPLLANLAGVSGGGGSQLETEESTGKPMVLKPTTTSLEPAKRKPEETSVTGPSSVGGKSRDRTGKGHISSQHCLLRHRSRTCASGD